MIIIRLANREDCQKCEELSRIKELRTAGGGYIPESYFQEFIEGKGMFMVAELNNKIVGYVVCDTLTGPIGYVSLLTVDIKHRNDGIGTKLISTLFKKCKEIGISHIECDISVFGEF